MSEHYSDEEIAARLRQHEIMAQSARGIALEHIVRQLLAERAELRAEVEAANKELKARDMALYMIANQPPITEQDIIWAEETIRKLEKPAAPTNESEYFATFGRESEGE